MEQSAEHKLDHHEAVREIMRWLAIAPQPRNVNDLLAALEKCVLVTPFNLVQGQWFLGTTSLPNQAEMDRQAQNLEFMEGVNQERHHRIMELITERNRLQAQVDQLAKAEKLLDEVFEALDGEEPAAALRPLRRRYDEYRGSRKA